jgi:hypothetical protein
MAEMFTEGDRYLKTTGIQLRQLQWQQRSTVKITTAIIQRQFG